MSRFFGRLSLPVQIFIVQFCLIFGCALFSFRNLTWWDGEWYAHIVRHGYSATLSADPTVPNLGNVGFFPGYPLAGWIVQKILSFGGTSFSPEYSILIVSLISCLLFLSYLWKWMHLNYSRSIESKMLLLALYPFSMFLFVAYSEAIYSALVVFFFYFSERFIRNQSSGEPVRKKWFWLALLSGFLMNGTRLLGIVFVIYPLLRAFQVSKAKGQAAILALGSLLSVALFFEYCQIRFHAWNFYFITEDAIWGTKVDWSKILPPTELFNFARPLRGDTSGKYIFIFLGVYLTYRLFLMLKVRDWKNPFLALVLVCGMFWGEHLIGRAAWAFAGMGRMMLPLLALLLPFMSITPKRNLKWALLALFLLSLQIAYALKFGRHGWVA